MKDSRRPSTSDVSVKEVEVKALESELASAEKDLKDAKRAKERRISSHPDGRLPADQQNASTKKAIESATANEAEKEEEVDKLRDDLSTAKADLKSAKDSRRPTNSDVSDKEVKVKALEAELVYAEKELIDVSVTPVFEDVNDGPSKLNDRIPILYNL